MNPTSLILGLALIGNAQVPPDAAAAARSITAEQIRAHVKFLSSDLLEGRGPCTRGDQLAESYVATELEAMGLAPGAPGGGWIQKVPLVAIAPTIPGTMTFTKGEKKLDLKYRDDFVAVPGTQQPTSGVKSAEVVFVGYGIVAPEYQWNDFKDVDVRGKVLLVMNNDPESDPNLFAGKTRLWYGRWDYKYLEAAKHGAAGAIIIHTTTSASYPWSVVRTSWSGEFYELPDEGTPRTQLKAWATDDASHQLAALGGQDLDKLRAAAESRDFRPVPLGVTLSFTTTSHVQRKESGNVIGEIRGSDPKLSKEVVIYTAHHDHLGVKVGAAPGVDAIFNGAVDNASGVATLLAIARAYTRLPQAPRRTVMFASVAAEEQGLLGSEYLAKHPPVPAGFIAANINMDSVNIWGKTSDVPFIGLGKSELDAVVAEMAAAQGRKVVPDAFPDRGAFYRSDQFNFARIGVPAVKLGSGIEVIGKPPRWGAEQQERYERTDYHQPSDEYRDTWDLAGAVEDAQLEFLIGVKVGNTDAMPRWRAGDEFEAARTAALKGRSP